MLPKPPLRGVWGGFKLTTMKHLTKISILAVATLLISCAKDNLLPDDSNSPVAAYAENTGATTKTDAPTSDDTYAASPFAGGENAANNEIYQRMMAKKAQYPHKMTWTNDSIYAWKGGIFKNGKGCAAFAFILSDAAFGSTPARKHSDFDSLKVGDVLCIDNAAHTVMVIAIDKNNITLAEGNVLLNGDSSETTTPYIYWGRKMNIDDARNAMTFILTRYETAPPAPLKGGVGAAQLLTNEQIIEDLRI